MSGTAERDRAIQRMLRAIREHLGLDVAFVSQFIDGQRLFRYVDAGTGGTGVEVGQGDPMEESYCHHVVNGSLPRFLSDPRAHPVSAAMRATAEVGVGTHLSVPIRFSDGRTYGTFCCFGLGVHDGLADRDAEVLQLLAELVSEYLEELDAEERAARARRDRVVRVRRDQQALQIVFQPIVELASDKVTAVEALARFPGAGSGPQVMFAEAWDVGLGVELELDAVGAALMHLPELPAGIRLGVNVAPETLVSDEFLATVDGLPAGRLTVEVTEHAAVEDYDALKAARQRLSARGIHLAIDDVGMGFSGLNHILECDPDILKIDAAVVRDVHTNPAKAAMIEALVSFGDRAEVILVAEGIETAEELRVLRELGVGFGQGYHLARPGRLDAVLPR